MPFMRCACRVASAVYDAIDMLRRMLVVAETSQHARFRPRCLPCAAALLLPPPKHAVERPLRQRDAVAARYRAAACRLICAMR